MKRSLIVTAGVTCGVLPVLWMIAGLFTLGVTEDGSEQYLALAQSIRDGTFFSPPRYGIDGYNHIVRTFGYPLVLVLAQWIGRLSGLEAAILFLHFVIGTFTLAALFLTFPRACVLPWALVLIAAFISILGGHALVVMPEWLAMNFQIWIALMLYRAFAYRSQRALFVVYLLSAVLTVVRPEFVVWLGLFGIAVGWRGRNRPIRTFGYLVLGVLPVLLWCSANHVRYGFRTLSPLGMYSLYGLSAGLSFAVPALGTPTELAEVSRSFARPFPDDLLVPFTLDDRVGTELIAILNDNFKIVGQQLEARYEFDWVKTYDQMNSAALLGLRESPIRYLLYFWLGLQAFVLFQPALTCCLFAAVGSCVFFRRQPSLANVIIVLWVLHFARGVLVVATTVPCTRYAIVTLAPLTFLTVLLLLLSVIASTKGSQSD
jgi:hypothetical protein